MVTGGVCMQACFFCGRSRNIHGVHVGPDAFWPALKYSAGYIAACAGKAGCNLLHSIMHSGWFIWHMHQVRGAMQPCRMAPSAKGGAGRARLAGPVRGPGCVQVASAARLGPAGGGARGGGQGGCLRGRWAAVGLRRRC